jgi:uncharacterized protein (DUF342 family)
MSEKNPLINRYLATKQFFEAQEVAGIEQLLPDPKGPNALPPPVNPKIKLDQDKLELEKMKHQDGLQETMITLRMQYAMNEAKVAELQAKAAKETAEAGGVDTGHRIALMNAEIGARKAEQEGMLHGMEILQETMDQRHRHTQDIEKQKADIAQGKGTTDGNSND